jgi:hypothetical protein
MQEQLTAVPQELRRDYERPEPEPSTPRPLTKQQILEQYEIRIQFLSRGCIVNVGCKSIAFDKVEDAISCIKTYVEDPLNVGEYWRGQFNMI